VLLNVYSMGLIFSFFIALPFVSNVADIDLVHSHPYFGVAFWYLVVPARAAFMSVVVICIIAVGTNFLLRIVPMGIPWRTFIGSFFVRFSFTQAPLTARQVEFHDLALRLSFLNHSQAYSQPESLNVITDWMVDMPQSSTMKPG
jgi:hypothetical protein